MHCFHLAGNTCTILPKCRRSRSSYCNRARMLSSCLHLQGEVDLLIPRGSKEFVSYMEQNSRIPVLGHGEGICHVYVDRAADVKKAVAITLDSKIQYPAACNSMETLLVHQRHCRRNFCRKSVAEFKNAKVEVRACPRVLAFLPEAQLVPASRKRLVD